MGLPPLYLTFACGPEGETQRTELVTVLKLERCCWRADQQWLEVVQESTEHVQEDADEWQQKHDDGQSGWDHGQRQERHDLQPVIHGRI